MEAAKRRQRNRMFNETPAAELYRAVNLSIHLLNSKNLENSGNGAQSFKHPGIFSKDWLIEILMKKSQSQSSRGHGHSDRGHGAKLFWCHTGEFFM